MLPVCGASIRLAPRWVGHKVFADLHIDVDPGLSMQEAHMITQDVETVLRNHVRSFGGVVVQLCPAA